MTSERYACFHGHFYQPPRENPWTEEVELQESARPFHDWNERIHAECYEPNAMARVLDDSGALARVVRTYDRLSFDFGPTLLAWMARRAPATYDAILRADRVGRGAVAQAYAHPILPLCTDRDRETQVRWGLADFEHRFGRKSRGMWLPETAVDLNTLDTLAAHGVAWTILAPSQADAWRPLDSEEWSPTSESSAIDDRVPYRVRLPSSRDIAVFFYDPGISSALAFGGLLSSGARLVERIHQAFPGESSEARLVSAATDGETFGHHHAFGEMALAWAIDRLERDLAVRLTTFDEFLSRHPPRREVRLRERTAWSCAHGLGRWAEDCGCVAAPASGYRQTWRRPLRDALDALNEDLAGCFERVGGRLLSDPWAARNDYVDVVLDRSPVAERAWLETHARRDPSRDERVTTLRLLEMQRHTLLMYASCAWFFDEVSGIETVQALRHAARAAELGEAVTGEPYPARLAEKLGFVPSNRAEYGTARGVLAREVAPARVGPRRVAVHHAVRRLFDVDVDPGSPAFRVVERDRWRVDAPSARLASGRLEVESRLTGEERRFVYAFVHAGGVDVAGSVRPDLDDGVSHRARVDRIEAHLARDEVPGARACALEGTSGDTLADLRPDTQRAIVQRVLETAIREVEDAHERLYRERETTLARLHDLSIPAPRVLVAAAELVLDARLRRALDAPEPDPATVRTLFDEVERSGATLDAPTIDRAASRAVERLVRRVAASPDDPARVDRLLALLSAFPKERVRLESSRAQVELYRLLERLAADRGALPAGFRALARALRVRIDP